MLLHPFSRPVIILSLANHLVANQVVEKGDLLIKYSETMEESQKTALEIQLQRLEKQKEGLGILKQSLEKATDLFSGEDEFGYHNTFMNFTNNPMILNWVSQRLTLRFQIKPILPIAVHQPSNKKLQKFNNKLENIKS